MNIVEEFNKYISAIDAEDKKEEFSTSKDVAKKYITGFLSDDNIAEAKRKLEMMSSSLNNDQKKRLI
jgi:hypothetical protein